MTLNAANVFFAESEAGKLRKSLNSMEYLQRKGSSKMRCPKCGTEHNGKFCPECGSPVQQQATYQSSGYQAPQYSPAPTPQKKSKTKGCLIALAIAVILLLLFIIIGIVSTSGNSSASSLQSSSQSMGSDSASIASSIEPTESVAYTDDFRHDIRTVLNYHRDLEDGTISDAEAAGMWTAFKLNLSLYKSNYGATSLEYRAYYYAMYGEDEYMKEFDYNDAFVEDIQEYFQDM